MPSGAECARWYNGIYLMNTIYSKTEKKKTKIIKYSIFDGDWAGKVSNKYFYWIFYLCDEVYESSFMRAS